MKKNVAKVAAFTLAMGFSMASFWCTAQAAEGWNMVNGEWSYYDSENRPLTEVWKKSKEYWYYLSENGVILKNTIFKNRGSVYYVDQDGKMAENTWIYVNSENNIHPDEFEEGWYYFGIGGKAYQRRNNSFKKTVGDSSYIFDESGRMLSGWFDAEGNVIDNSDDPFVDGIYYSREDGKLLTGEWLNYGDIDDGVGGSDLYSEVGERSYSEYEAMWMFFDSNSKKVETKGSDLKRKIINGSEYAFDENGIMLSWWSRVASFSNAGRSNPTSDVPTRFYSEYDGGILLQNSWLWMYPSENLDSEEYYNQESSWWRTDNRGKVHRNKIMNINGRSYAFDGIGRMQTGFVLFDKKSEFVARYKVDDWSSEDFIQGNLYGIERADLYLFSPDELNDGSMQTGKDIAVALNDGVFHFGFASNGKAFGNRNRIQKKNGSYYINGIRIDADENYGYGVVEVTKDSGTYYQVVNSEGRIIEGNRKIVRDADGGYLLISNNKFVAYCDDEYKPRWRRGDSGTGFYHYDKDNKDDHFARGLIPGTPNAADISSLPEEERLNF